DAGYWDITNVGYNPQNGGDLDLCVYGDTGVVQQSNTLHVPPNIKSNFIYVVTISEFQDKLMQLAFPMSADNGYYSVRYKNNSGVWTDWQTYATQSWVTTQLNNLPDQYTDEKAQDAVGNILSNEFTYDDANNGISINSIAASKITGLATVATSGSYNDLTNTLTAGVSINIDAQNKINAVWAATPEW